MNRFLLLSVLGVTACVREPVEWICPEVAPGQLIVSELRGPQSADDDVLGEWIEVFNASNTTLDLQGLNLRVIRLDNSNRVTIVVRDPLIVEPGEYAVLGRFLPGIEPDHVDYGYIEDLNSDLYDSGVVEVVACGETVDVVVYRDLPNVGTYAFGGAPDAALNDEAERWCIELGSPGEENPPCF